MTLPRLYSEWADWWPLVSPPAEHAEEAALFRDAIERTAVGPVLRVLELGSGGGNTAGHWSDRWDLTLVDVSPAMLEVSRRANPGCDHVEGDMRSVRLPRAFDAVFVHDAVMHLASEDDLLATMRTARAHLRQGGVALFVPDDVSETWSPSVSHGGADGDGRSVRWVQWDVEDGPARLSIAATMVLLFREVPAPPRVEHETMRLGLFPRATWRRLLSDAGLVATTLPFRHSTFAPDAGRDLFLGLRPG